MGTFYLAGIVAFSVQLDTCLSESVYQFLTLVGLCYGSRNSSYQQQLISQGIKVNELGVREMVQ